MKVSSAQSLPIISPYEQGKATQKGRLDFSALLQNTISAHYNLVQNAMKGVTTPTLSHHNLSTQRPTPQPRMDERALGLRAYRQDLLPSNIANADTLSYRTGDTDISSAILNGKTRN